MFDKLILSSMQKEWIRKLDLHKNSTRITFGLLFTAALALRSRGQVIGSREKEEKKREKEKEEGLISFG